MSRPPKLSSEVQERAVRTVLEHAGEHESGWAAMRSIARRIGCTTETLRRRVRQTQVNEDKRPGVTAAEVERIKELERKNRELRRANETLKLGSAFFAQAELDCRLK